MNAGTAVLGLVNGLIIGLLAVGLVLVYRANRFLNLAHAGFGVLAATVMAKLVIDRHWNWWAAFAVSVPLGSLLAVVVYTVLIRRLQAKTKSSVVLLLASIGIAELLATFGYLKALTPSPIARAMQGGFPLPFGVHLKIGGVVLQGDSVAILIIAPLLVLALSAMLRYSVLGKMSRAAAANEDEARLCGISVERVSSVVWAIAGGLSAVTAILSARSTGVGISSGPPSTGAELLFVALGAAALGGFRSISLALVGGLGLGLAQQITLGVSGSASEATLVVFVLILLIVFTRGRRIAGAFESSTTVLEDQRPLQVPKALTDHALVRHRRAVLVVPALLLAGVAPRLPYLRTNAHQFLLIMILVYAMMSVSLTILIGWAGQISLGHVAVLAAGAYMAARLIPHGVSLLVVVAFAGMVGAAILVVVGLPALRIRGLTLAVTTLGLAVLGPQWLFQQSWFGSTKPYGLLVQSAPGVAKGLGRPSSMLSIYYVTLVLLVVVVVAVHGLRRSRPGRLLIAVRDNERSAEAFGVSPASAKLAMLAVSGFIAGVAGAMYAQAWQVVATPQFSPDLSLALIAVPVIGGIGSLTGAVAGALFVYIPAYFASPALNSLFGSSSVAQAGLLLLITGLTLPLTLLAYPTGVVGAAQRGIEVLLARMAAARARLTQPGGQVVPLEVEGVSIAFGGVRALDGASITVPEGKIVGLIGPNGAGKTTLINAISGALVPSAGSIKLFGREVVGLPASYRPAFGVARSFQDARLFPGLTLVEAIQVALSRAHRVGIVSSMMWAPWARASERRCRARADELVSRFGLAQWRDTLTSDLSTGTRRICDLTAQVATGAKILLLDEPTAGVAQREAEAFGPFLRRVRDELECSILIVEHDMPLLMSLCDWVYAMEAGTVIAEGTPEEIRSDPRVIASYLGTDDVAITRSGGAPPRAVKRKASSGSTTATATPVADRPIRTRAHQTNGRSRSIKSEVNGNGGPTR